MMTMITFSKCLEAFRKQNDEIVEDAKAILLESYSETLLKPFKAGFEAGLRYASDVWNHPLPSDWFVKLENEKFGGTK